MLSTSKRDFHPIRGAQVGICFHKAEDQLSGPTVLDDVGAFGLLNLGISREGLSTSLDTVGTIRYCCYLKERSVNWLSGGEKNFCCARRCFGNASESVVIR